MGSGFWVPVGDVGPHDVVFVGEMDLMMYQKQDHSLTHT